MRLIRRATTRYVIDITWYPDDESRVDFVFHRRAAMDSATMERQRQAGVRDPGGFTNVVLGTGSCPPATMVRVQDYAYTWLEEHHGADRERDSFVLQNWTAKDKELVEGRVGSQ